MKELKEIFSKYKSLLSSKKTSHEKKDDDNEVNDKENERIDNKDKKKIENIVFLILILIITVVIINAILKDKSISQDNIKEKSQQENKQFVKINSDTVTTSNFDIQEDLEERIANILQDMQGVGKVKVLITYSRTSQTIPIYNESNKNSLTEEEDSEGGTRKQCESDVEKEVVLDSNNEIITESIAYPKIEGAIIIAEGAKNLQIKNNIIQAVSAVTGLASHKVQVFEYEV